VTPVNSSDAHESSPLVVELAGVPAAGKTSTALALREELSRRSIDSHVIAEAAARSPLKHLKRAWTFNAWTLCQTVADYLEHVGDSSGSVVIFDRGLIDALAWIRWFRIQRQINDETWNALNNFARIPTWFNRTDLTFVLRVQFDTALRRHGRPGQIVNRKTYAELDEAYSATVGELVDDGCGDIQVIDTDALSVSQVVAMVLHAIDRVRRRKLTASGHSTSSSEHQH
jgi:thymidylate kinase